MAWKRGYKKSYSSSLAGGVYNTGAATYEIRRHTRNFQVEIEPNKAKLIPLLVYHNGEPSNSAITAGEKISGQGSKYYPTVAVQEGSLVSNIKLDITIEPKTQNSSNIINFYTGRIMTSFHDVAGGQIYGLEKDGSTQGKVKFSDEASSATTSDIVNSSGLDQASSAPALSLTNAEFERGDVIKHWWRGKRKNVMFGGQPIVYDRWERVPKKVKRCNQGMFYGMWVMNDATSVSGDTDVLLMDFNISFNERPLIQ